MIPVLPFEIILQGCTERFFAWPTRDWLRAMKCPYYSTSSPHSSTHLAHTVSQVSFTLLKKKNFCCLVFEKLILENRLGLRAAHKFFCFLYNMNNSIEIYCGPSFCIKVCKYPQTIDFIQFFLGNIY